MDLFQIKIEGGKEEENNEERSIEEREKELR